MTHLITAAIYSPCLAVERLKVKFDKPPTTEATRFPSEVRSPANEIHINSLCSCDTDLDLMTFIYELDLDILRCTCTSKMISIRNLEPENGEKDTQTQFFAPVTLTLKR